MSRTRSAVVASLGTSLLAWSVPAAAQLEEVTVTAERRESSLQTVPVAITAYTSEDLERFQIEMSNSSAELLDFFLKKHEAASGNR